MAINKDCDVCGGLGTIRLPVRQRLSKPDIAVSPSVPIREYTCPECGYKIPQDRIKIFYAQDVIVKEVKEDDYLNHMKNSLALRIGDEIYRDNQIIFNKQPINDPYLSRYQYCLNAKVGIISPRLVVTFEERVKERQREVAVAIVQEVTNLINNWGSYYNNRQDIMKDHAINCMHEALRKFK